MPRDPLPLVIEDLSNFATRLRRRWPAEAPGQSEALALIARAAGYRNHQELRADHPSETGLTGTDERRLRDALRCFDAEGRLIRWPQGKDSVQPLVLAAFWSRIPGRRALTEGEVNEALKTIDGTGDHVLIRRELIGRGRMTRNPDGTNYRRVERKPTSAERSLIRTLGERWLAEAR